MTLPDAPRDVEQAIAWEANQINNPTRQDWNGPTYDWLGACQSVTRQGAGVPVRDGDATTGWNRAVYRHAPTLTPPRGAIVFMTGGSSGHGHVMRSLGGGGVLSNDFYRRGWIDVVNLGLLVSRWTNLTLVGWANDINGYLAMPLDGEQGEGGDHEQLPQQEEDDEMYFIVAWKNAQWVVDGGLKGKAGLHQGADVNALLATKKYTPLKLTDGTMAALPIIGGVIKVDDISD